jgi:hypothetical protein
VVLVDDRGGAPDNPRGVFDHGDPPSARRAYPGVDTDAGVQAIGYQILKMDDLSRFARRGPTSREETFTRPRARSNPTDPKG